MKGHKANHHGENSHSMVKKHSMHSLKGRSHHAKGGKVSEGVMASDPTPSEVYAGKGSKVVAEASKHKRGGAAKHVAADGKHASHRLDRPARKHGGKVGGGAEMHPLSAAHNLKTPAGRHVESGES